MFLVDEIWQGGLIHETEEEEDSEDCPQDLIMTVVRPHQCSLNLSNDLLIRMKSSNPHSNQWFGSQNWWLCVSLGISLVNQL